MKSDVKFLVWNTIGLRWEGGFWSPSSLEHRFAQLPTSYILLMQPCRINDHSFVANCVDGRVDLYTIIINEEGTVTVSEPTPLVKKLDCVFTPSEACPFPLKIAPLNHRQFITADRSGLPQPSKAFSVLIWTATSEGLTFTYPVL